MYIVLALRKWSCLAVEVLGSSRSPQIEGTSAVGFLEVFDTLAEAQEAAGDCYGIVSAEALGTTPVGEKVEEV